MIWSTQHSGEETFLFQEMSRRSSLRNAQTSNMEHAGWFVTMALALCAHCTNVCPDMALVMSNETNATFDAQMLAGVWFEQATKYVTPLVGDTRSRKLNVTINTTSEIVMMHIESTYLGRSQNYTEIFTAYGSTKGVYTKTWNLPWTWWVPTTVLDLTNETMMYACTNCL